MMTMMQNSQRSARSVSKSLMFEEVVSTIRLAIDNSSLCNTVFAGQALVPNAPASITINGQTLKTDASTQNGALKIQTLQFTNINDISATAKTAILYLKADMRGNDLEKRIGSPTKDASFNVAFTVDASNVIVGCGLSAGPSPSPSPGAAPAIQSVAMTSGICTTGHSSYDRCTVCTNWPIPFPDSNYAVSCSGVNPYEPGGSPAATLNVQSKSANNVCVTIETQRSRPASYAEIDCVGSHP
jgi:hypothetical protein